MLIKVDFFVSIMVDVPVDETDNNVSIKKKSAEEAIRILQTTKLDPKLIFDDCAITIH